MNKAWVYILQCSDGSYYTGKTQNLEKRIAEHNAGTYPGYTEKRKPVELKFSQNFQTYVEAIAAERQIKGWSRVKKEALINGDFDLLKALAECKNESHSKNNQQT